MEGAYVWADRPAPEAYDQPGSTRRLAALAKVAAKLGVPTSQLVWSWLLGHGPGISPIVGVSTLGQLDQAMDAQSLELGELRTHLDEAS